MKWVISFVALLFLASSAVADVQTWHVFANLTTAQPTSVGPYALSIPVLSEGGLLVLNITTDISVAVCLKHMISPAADATTWNSTCDYYAAFHPSNATVSEESTAKSPLQAATGTRRTFRLKKMSVRDAAQGNLPDAFLSQGYYFAGVFALDTAQITKGYAVANVDLSGEVCTDGMVGEGCNTKPAEASNKTTTVELAGEEYAYYTLTVPPQTANVSVSVKFNATTSAAAEAALFSFARKDNIPIAPGQFENPKGVFAFSANSTQANSTVSLQLDLAAPVPGTWYVSMYNNNNGPVSAQVTFSDPAICPAGFAGSACQYAVSGLDAGFATGALVSGTVNTDAWVFYSVEVLDTNKNFLVNVRSVEGANPHVYLNANALPSATTYLAKDCNVAPASCVSVQKIETFVATNATWFIGVQGTADNQAFGIWLTTSCPADCSGHGACETDTGVCTCSDYTGLDCAIEDSSSGGFKTVYIVLIVIGCVVVAGIIIGVIIYLRGRGRQGYNQI